jgi:hypothetical protein
VKQTLPQGLKPRLILMHVTYGLKPVPFKPTRYGRRQDALAESPYASNRPTTEHGETHRRGYA